MFGVVTVSVLPSPLANVIVLPLIVITLAALPSASFWSVLTYASGKEPPNVAASPSSAFVIYPAPLVS